MESKSRLDQARKDLAFFQGRTACIVGRSRESCPYIAGSTSAQQWLKGYAYAEVAR